MINKTNSFFIRCTKIAPDFNYPLGPNEVTPHDVTCIQNRERLLVADTLSLPKNNMMATVVNFDEQE